MTKAELLRSAANTRRAQPKPDAKRKPTIPEGASIPSNAPVNQHRETHRQQYRDDVRGGDDGDGDGDGGDPPKPARLHLDKRAANIALAVASDGSDDDLLTTIQIANWLGVSTQWLEIARGKDYGPPFLRIAPQMIRYKRSTLLEWLKQREYARTSDYLHPDARSKNKKSARSASKVGA